MKTVIGLMLLAGTLAVAQAWYLDVDCPLDKYPGDNNDFQRIGWGDDGYYRGGGVWHCEENCDSSATQCPPCSYWWKGKGCVSTGAPSCNFASSATCGPCNVWSANGNVQQCTLSPGCGSAYGRSVPSAAAVAVTSGGGTAFTAGNGNGCVVNGNGGCMISGNGNSAAAAASGSGTASAMSWAGGRRLK